MDDGDEVKLTLTPDAFMYTGDDDTDTSSGFLKWMSVTSPPLQLKGNYTRALKYFSSNYKITNAKNERVALDFVTMKVGEGTSSFKTLITIIFDLTGVPEEQKIFLQNGFYVHGRAGVFDEINYEDESFKNQILPTKWYDKQEPFEFEFVVNDQVGVHKIFDNLVIISNNVQPNEIEYEFEGDVYEFNKAGIFRHDN